MKRGLRALAELVKGSGAQVVFSSVLPVAGNDGARNRKVMQMNTWLQDGCKQQHFVVFDHGSVYTTLSLLATSGVHLYQKGKGILAQDSAGLIERALNWI